MTSPRTQALSKADRAHVWHPFTQMQDYAATEPLIVESASGNWLVDTEGNRYLDGVSSLWCNVHGHGVPELDQALSDQLERVAHSTLLCLYGLHRNQDQRRLLEEHRRWGELHEARVRRPVKTESIIRNSDKRLRIGYVCQDLRWHPVGRFMVPILEAHDHDRFEIFCYASLKDADVVTERCKAFVDQLNVQYG